MPMSNAAPCSRCRSDAADAPGASLAGAAARSAATGGGVLEAFGAPDAFAADAFAGTAGGGAKSAAARAIRRCGTPICWSAGGSCI